MGSSMHLKQWLQDLYAPTVVVAATPAADAIVATKNGLTLVDLLRPYSSVSGLNVPLRVGEASVRVQDLRIAFCGVSTTVQPAVEAMEHQLHEVLKASAQRHVKMEGAQDLVRLMQSDPPPDMRTVTPWYYEYRQEFFRLLQFGDHETVHHPVACIYAIPADVPSPPSHFEALAGQVVLPPLMGQAVMVPIKDKDFAKHYLLVLDVAGGMDEKKAMDNLAAMRRLHGDVHCSLLKVNSGNGDRNFMGAPPEYFRAQQRPCLPGGGAGEPEARPPVPPNGIGAFLSVQDLDAVGAFVRDFAARSLLPRLEERMTRLNAAITATRRGLRNRLNRLWKGAGDDKQADRPYPWHSVESQMRQLGDLSFLLGQYGFAEATYRLAAQDYLSDGNNRWYAGVEEMIGLCSVLADPADPLSASASSALLGGPTDPMKYFQRAYENYPKPPAAAAAPTAAVGQNGTSAASGAASVQAVPGSAGAAAGGSGSNGGSGSSGRLGRLLATRAMMLGAAVQSATGRHLAACHGLMRAHFEEENARSALMLEQAAFALLHLRPPSTRKFAFQLVLAGIRFFTGGQKRLATHAYRQVLGLYSGQKWHLIEEQINTVLGNQCLEAGDRHLALWHYRALLEACGPRPAPVQQHFLAQFLSALSGIRDQEALVQGGVSMVDSLPLPIVNRHDVRVVYDDAACYAGAEARKVPDTAWQKMEAACSSELGSSNWLAEGSGKLEREHEEYNICVAGEEISVLVEFRNPLAVKLKVSHVRLLVQYSADGASPAPPASSASSSGVGLAALLPSASTSSLDGNGIRPGQGPLASASSGGPALAALNPLDPLLGGEAAAPADATLHIVPCQLTLHPNEVLVEPLRLVPRAAGWVRVLGVAWRLEDVAQGRVAFDVKGRHRKRPKGNRPGQLKHYPPHRRLLFQVLPAMPRLEMSMDHLPRSLYSGELARVVMRLSNAGALPLRNLALVLAHPEAVCPATDANLRKPLLDCLADPREVVVTCKIPAAIAAHNRAVQLYRLWPGRELAPGESLEWPLWLHPRGSGALRLQLLWYGEPTGIKGGMRCRTLRVCWPLQVQPLLSVRPSLLVPSATSQLARHMLRLDIDNSSKDAEPVTVQQVAAITLPHSGPGRPAAEAAAQPSDASSLRPGPSASAWHLAPVANQSAAEAGIAEATGSCGPSLPLSARLYGGESTSLFVQLVAPPTPEQRGAACGAQAGPSSAGEAAALSRVASADRVPGAAADGSDRQQQQPERAGTSGQSLQHVDLLAATGILAYFARPRGAVGGLGHSGSAHGSTASLQQAGSGRRAAGGTMAPPGPGPGPGSAPGTGGTAAPPRPPTPSGAAGPLGNAAGPYAAPPPAGAPPAPGGAYTPGGMAAAHVGGALPGPTGGPPSRPQLPLADPPLDLLLLWDMPTGVQQAQLHGPQRLGLVRPWDTKAGRSVWSAIKAHTPPIRMVLSGCPAAAAGGGNSVGGPGQGPVIRHDFRRGMLAVVPLTLTIRNNTALDAKLQVEAGGGSHALGATNAWQVSTAAVQGQGHGPQPRDGPTGHSAPMSHSMMAITYQAGLPPAPDYSWVGPTYINVPQLAPGATLELPLSVCVHRPGTYIVHNYCCTYIIGGLVEKQWGEPLQFKVEGS